MTPDELQEKIDTQKPLHLSPDEFQKRIDLQQQKTQLGPNELQAKVDQKRQMEEKSFIAKHPNLYGVFGAAQSLVPYLKYIDPTERERFAKLSTQKQTRELLVQNLEAVSMVGAAPITKGLGTLITKYLPKTYKALKFIKTPTKEWGELLRTPSKQLAGKRLADGEELVAQKIAVYKKSVGEAPPPEMIRNFWKDAGMAVKASVPPKAVAAGEATVKTPETAIERVQAALKKAKPIRKEQEKLYTIERKKRMEEGVKAAESLTGEARYRAKTAALKGEMPTADFEPLKISQEDTDALFNIIEERLPDFWKQETAGRGLAKLFGEFGGKVPQEGELKLLRKVFPKDFIDTLTKKQSTFTKMKEWGFEAINIPRAFMASFDLSAPLRQGIFLAPKHPIRFTQSFVKMFKQFGSEKAYHAAQESLTQKKWYSLLREGGLQITEVGGGLASREEAFMGANLAERVPLAGKVVKASNQAYTGFLNKLRADVGDDLVEKAFKVGLDPENNPTLVKAITKFVNAGTGRGDLGALESAAVALNSTFFSPRLMSSRLTILNPYYYVNPKTPAFVRKEALKSLFAFSTAIGTTLGLADMIPGVEVGKDIRSANFGKIRINDTRIDIMGGFQQYLRIAGQFATKKYISSTTGKEYTLGEGYKPMTRKDIIERGLASKLSPPASFAYNLLKQQDAQGKPISVPKEIGQRFVPMVMQDVYDLAKEDPDLLPLSVLGIFGVGLQTYKDRVPLPSSPKGISGIGGLETGIGGF